MTDDLTDFLINELGFSRKPVERPGLTQSTEAFLGVFLGKRTSIQQLGIETLYDGDDALLIAATASGKTEAAMVPIAARLLIDEDPSLALYVAPTRALLNDIQKRLASPLHRLGLQVALRHGDYALPSKTDNIRVLLTTPESLDVMLSKKNLLLERCRYIIIDEVHQLYGNPRGDQLSFLLQRLKGLISRPLQIIALSATLGDPESVARWLCPHAKPARIIADSHPRKIVASFRWQADNTIFHRLLVERRHNKVLVFSNSRRRCDDIFLEMQGSEPYEVFVHYSTLEKEAREHVERGFKSAQFAACVATSTLELGIDIGSIHDVVLADPPGTVGAFLQRIGRGGRRGDANHVTIAPQSKLQLLHSIALLTLARSGRVEPESQGRPYSVAVQQIFSLLASKRRLQIHPTEIYELFSQYAWLDKQTIETILDQLTTKGYLIRMPNHQTFEIGPKLEELIEARAIYTNIGDDSGGVVILHAGKPIGRVPLRPDQIRLGNIFLFAGRYWKIAGITNEGLRVQIANPIQNPVRPTWGRNSPLSMSGTVAQGLRDVLVQRPDLGNHELDSKNRQLLEALYDKAPRSPQAPNSLWHENKSAEHIYFTFAGAVANRVLQLLFEKAGMDCQPALRFEALALTSKQILRFNDLAVNSDNIIETVGANWSALSKWVAKGPYFDLLPKALQRDEIVARIATPQLIEIVRNDADKPILDVALGLVE